MSNTITFGVRTSMTQEELQEQLGQLWVGDEAAVLPATTKRETLSCVLYWYFGSEAEKRAGARIAHHLIECSSDQRVYYYRCEETAEWAEDSGQTLYPDQIFDPEYEPDMSLRYHYFYTVVGRKAEAPGAGSGEVADLDR